MAVAQIANPRLRAQFSPRPASAAAGIAQRVRLETALSGMRWWSALGGLIGVALFTALAVWHTDQVMAAAAGGGTAAVIPSGPNVPSQSLFTQQVSNSGGFLGSPSSNSGFGGSPYRSASS